MHLRRDQDSELCKTSATPAEYLTAAGRFSIFEVVFTVD